MAKLTMFPSGEDKKQLAKRQALHDEQLRQEQLTREKRYDPLWTPEEVAAKRAADIEAADGADAAAIAASPNYIDPDPES